VVVGEPLDLGHVTCRQAQRQGAEEGSFGTSARRTCVLPSKLFRVWRRASAVTATINQQCVFHRVLARPSFPGAISLGRTSRRCGGT
jgi:hypothetical protein